MKGTIRSEQFDDVYFSADDGLAETKHVFLRGNDLPSRFMGHDVFTVGETGFGTGLNFLAVWALFDEHKVAGQRLRFVSFEKYPLEVEAMRAALAPWADVFGDRVERMLEAYSDGLRSSELLLVAEDVELCVHVGDVNDVIAALDDPVDCWFLDGFTPSKNPDMWTDVLFENMARLSSYGCGFSTFTAAGFVKRGLQEAGFEVRKSEGFGRKRDMLCGVYRGEDITK